jgi:ABC-type dipeptide/oligopeptide/nickel transport system ATPase component
MSEAVLSVQGLCIDFGATRVVDGVSFALAAGETLGIVGESGSGKTLTALALLRILPPGARIAGGSIRLAGEELVDASEERMRALRGRGMAMVFQEPLSALDPVLTIGAQLGEVIVRHRRLPPKQAREVAIDSLARVGIAAPERRLAERPHQLSGGMRQRVLIAMALACEPQVLIADEPTTALDVTTQAQVLELIVRLQAEQRFGVLLITHDLAVVSETCARTLVMQSGRIVEEGATAQVVAAPSHPYTAKLLASTLSVSGAREARVS